MKKNYITSFLIILIDAYSLTKMQKKAVISSSNFECADNYVIQEISGRKSTDTIVSNPFY